MTYEEVLNAGQIIVRMPENRNYFVIYTSESSLKYFVINKNGDLPPLEKEMLSIDERRWLGMGAENWDQAVFSEKVFTIKKKRKIISNLFAIRL